MEEGREAFHDQQDGHGQGGKGSEDEKQRQPPCQTPDTQAVVDHHGPKYFRELWGWGTQVQLSLAKGKGV